MHKCVRAGDAPAVHTRPSTSRCLVILVSALLEPSSWFSPFYCHFQLYLLRLVTHGSSRQTIPLSTACKTFTGPTNCKCWQEHRRERGGSGTRGGEDKKKGFTVACKFVHQSFHSYLWVLFFFFFLLSTWNETMRYFWDGESMKDFQASERIALAARSCFTQVKMRRINER